MPDSAGVNPNQIQSPYKASRPVRFVTAASLFDGHDASINIMRRILQSSGAEVIHLGHNRSVDEVVTAALQEDVQGIAVSSYQGGHVEYFKYMIDLLKERGGAGIKVFGGGGGVIVPDEIKELHDYGVTRIYAPRDGQSLGLQGMIDDMIRISDYDLSADISGLDKALMGDQPRPLAQLMTALENGVCPDKLLGEIRKRAVDITDVPVLGITGTGGAGKSSLTDELVLRFREYSNEPKIAIIAIDPSRRKSGGALLGDRIRMNAIDGDNIFMRSIATRDGHSEVPQAVPDMIAACKVSGFDLVIVETPGIGQGDAGIVAHADVSLYVMTPEFGAASQLEKIDMLDFADVVAINKFDRKGGKDALRDVSKQLQRNLQAFDQSTDNMPVFGTTASKFNDQGVMALYQHLIGLFNRQSMGAWDCHVEPVSVRCSADDDVIVPASRQRYLAEISETVRGYHKTIALQSTIARERQQLTAAARMLELADKNSNLYDLENLRAEKQQALDPRAAKLLDTWPDVLKNYQNDKHITEIRGREIATETATMTLSGTRVPKVAVPNYDDDGELLKWLLKENLPGYFPYTAGVFPFKRENEDPTRMFAGEGDAFRTNRRYKLLSKDAKAKRLSVAYDSVTLYGFDPHVRPDIYGKVGNSGVSIATLDDCQELFDGFDLIDATTSVSMTINGPAPIALAFFMNTAIEQQIEKVAEDTGKKVTEKERDAIRKQVLKVARGTIQADILKEDQGQNTCIFSTEFALRMMADIQEYFVEHDVRNFYSVSISGYHIAEAGANPISQLAFTLSNGFTYVETYLARGMDINDFAPNLSFFFSYGMDPEYAVLGRVARRIWATAMRFKYGANAKSQKLKYHSQTSGRTLHAQEMDFNDVRTTLEALISTYDNTNSLHTNAYDEAITTPTPESVRRALAIQMIINQEWGVAKNQNPNQGSFIIDELTDLVEEAVLQEFERISERGGVLGAMETGYQRSKIQEESMLYEHKKHDGSYPIIGVNTFINPDAADTDETPELARSTDDEKQSQLTRLQDFKNRHHDRATIALDRVKLTATSGGNIFAELMEASRWCSMGQITAALFDVGGKYRRSM